MSCLQFRAWLCAGALYLVLAGGASPVQYSFEPLCSDCAGKVYPFGDGVLIQNGHSSLEFAHLPSLERNLVYEGKMSWLSVHENLAYFTENIPFDVKGCENLWVTDGTTDGTESFCIGTGLHGLEVASRVVESGDVCLFMDGYYLGGPQIDFQFQLWRSDGTSVGTELVSDLGTVSLAIDEFRLGPQIYGRQYWSKDIGGDGEDVELWSSDGTVEGTVLVHTFESAVEGVLWRFDYYVDFAGLVYFLVDEKVDGICLWRTDGTPGGTLRLRDLWLEEDSEKTYMAEFRRMDGGFYVEANESAVGTVARSVFVSDGTLEGTLPLTVAGWDWANRTILGKLGDTDLLVLTGKSNGEAGSLGRLAVANGAYVDLLAPRSISKLYDALPAVIVENAAQVWLFALLEEPRGGQSKQIGYLGLLSVAADADSADFLSCDFPLATTGSPLGAFDLFAAGGGYVLESYDQTLFLRP